ncbi:MAG: hypothetical protein QN720_06960 [Nitrososphaeraceae archaeon]|nr:hypothetical protein [Nitrososphaeraceae archaeon]MDW0332695.1 hypothetical protein [Nitrososphaeraceae archaeon]
MSHPLNVLYVDLILSQHDKKRLSTMAFKEQRRIYLEQHEIMEFGGLGDSAY